MNRKDANILMEEMVENHALRIHCLCVAIVMENIAMQTHQNEDDFFIAGLLHDADWEKHPETHPNVIVDKLETLEKREIAHAIAAHGTEWGVSYDTIMDRSLVAVDELTGFIYAVARIRPDGLKGLTSANVLKKLKNKAFATGVSRDEVYRGNEILGTKLECLIYFIIGVLMAHSQQVGLPLVDDLIQINDLNIPADINLNHRIENAKNLNQPSIVQLNEQQAIRHKKRDELITEGYDPYPGKTVLVDTKSCNINDRSTLGKVVKIAGRIMTSRIQGKSGFMDIVDDKGAVQVYYKTAGENSLGENEVHLIKKYLDRGDIVSITGIVFLTHTQTPTVHITGIALLTKSLRPLPAVKESVDEATGEKKVHDEFSNPELRFRQRYVDLIVNPGNRDIFINRTKIVDNIRSSFNQQGYLEVQTPILQPIYGGAAAKPFVTHHNTLDTKLYLRIANELYLKRLIVGGFPGVYEFSVDFRNEGMDRFHNPEFTQVELYVPYMDYNWMMDLVEETVEKIALAIHGQTIFKTFGHIVDFKRPWQRISMRDAILEKTDIDIAIYNEFELRKQAESLGLNIETEIVGKGKIIDELFGAMVEPYLIQPCFITSYPVELSPLAKRTPGNPEFTDRFEGFVCGKEFCNAFSELNDPVEQRKRFEEQLELGKRGDVEAMVLDEDFLRALEYGMPPTAGLGLGIDRLTMVMLDKNSIQEVILFPQMRAEKQ